MSYEIEHDCSDLHWNDYQPCEIPSDHKKTNYKQMKNKVEKKYPVEKSEEEWKEILDPQSYKVLREKGTERPFTGQYNLNKDTGIYECKACGNEIFHSSKKFDSGCGWPSFTEPVRPDAIDVHMDYSHFMIREEILCGKCGGHLGHRFPDGPKDQGGIRYCINSVSLDFKEGEGK